MCFIKFVNLKDSLIFLGLLILCLLYVYRNCSLFFLEVLLNWEWESCKDVYLMLWIFFEVLMIRGYWRFSEGDNYCMILDWMMFYKK